MTQYKEVIICSICGEETAGNPTYSFYGSAHKWGPRNHKFMPRKIYVKTEETSN